MVIRLCFQTRRIDRNNTIPNESSYVRLDNSQEIRHCFGTLGSEHQKRRESKNHDSGSRNDIDTVNLKRAHKGMAKTRKYLNERAQNVASIYKKGSLSIAHFLSNYALNQKQVKLMKKKKKSGRSITHGVLRKHAYHHVDIRSRSIHPQYQRPEQEIKSSENIYDDTQLNKEGVLKTGSHHADILSTSPNSKRGIK